MGLLSLLALSYLGSILDPARNLHDYPLVLVNADQGEYGSKVAEQVVAALPPTRVQLQVTDAAGAEDLLSLGKVFGAIVIPDNFSAQLTALNEPGPGRGLPPVVEVRTNPRAGSTAVTLTTQLVTPVLDHINRQLGVEATERARGNGVQLSDAALATLTEPMKITVTQYRSLPAGTANGISAFYYTLLVVFAGFTGGMLVSGGADAAVANNPNISGWRVLLYKWALVAVVALVMAAVYQVIAAGLGMPIEHRLTLYSFCAFASLAIGMTTLSILTVVATAASAWHMPALNSLGMPVNMTLFIALGLPSSGGIMPIQASPRLYGALADFEPMHQVYLGVRSILYYEGRAAAGLTRAVVMCTGGVVFAIAVGLLTTIAYERLRARAATTPPVPASSAADS